MSDKEKLNHCCKDVCSGWQDGYEKGFEQGIDMILEVLMHKKTGKLVEHDSGGWLGDFIIYNDMGGDEKITMDSPIIFSDDKKYKLHEYENLGAL